MRKKGLFIVIDGTDGSGKATQLEKLANRLKEGGYDVQTFDFPQYGKASSYFVKEYLNGKYGTVKEVGPYKASIFYAMDRYDVGSEIKKWLDQGKIVLSNRYVSANMGHQGAKIRNDRERRKFFEWLSDLEYNLLGIPKPDLTLVLHVTPQISQKLVDKKGKREYIGGRKRDLHEADEEHLKVAERTFLQMVKIFPKAFKLVECVEKGALLSPEKIHKKVWDVLKNKIK